MENHLNSIQYSLQILYARKDTLLIPIFPFPWITMGEVQGNQRSMIVYYVFFSKEPGNDVNCFSNHWKTIPLTNIQKLDVGRIFSAKIIDFSFQG